MAKNNNNSYLITEEKCSYLRTEGEDPKNSMPVLKFDNFMIKKKQNVKIEISNYYEQKENIHVNIQHENTPKKIKSLKFTKNQTNSRSGFLPKLFFKNNF